MMQVSEREGALTNRQLRTWLKIVGDGDENALAAMSSLLAIAKVKQLEKAMPLAPKEV